MNATFFLSFLCVIVGVRMLSLRNPIIAQEQRSIQPRRCIDETTNRTGVCMFAWNCMNSNGTHLTHCVEGFYIGSCCGLPEGATSPLLIIEDDGNNDLDSAKASHPYEDALDHTKENAKLTTFPPTPQRSTTSATLPFWKPTKFPPGLSTWRPNEITTTKTTEQPFTSLYNKNASIITVLTNNISTTEATTKNIPPLPNTFVTTDFSQSTSTVSSEKSTEGYLTASSSNSTPTSSVEVSVSAIDYPTKIATSNISSSSLAPPSTPEIEYDLSSTTASSTSETETEASTTFTNDSTSPATATREDTSTGSSSTESTTMKEQTVTFSVLATSGTETEYQVPENITYSSTTVDVIVNNATGDDESKTSLRTEESTVTLTPTTSQYITINDTLSQTQRTDSTYSTENVTAYLEAGENVTSQPTSIRNQAPTTTENTGNIQGDFRTVCGRPRPMKTPQGRIVGGGPSHFGEWPWVISLRQWKKNTFLHKCGAALLNEFWAITAAHCVENVPTTDLLLRLGEYDLNNEDEIFPYVERRVQLIASHPKFDRRTFEYDLALLRFYEPVTFERNILPICIPTGNKTYIGEFATVAGWGRLHEDGPLPNVMHEVEVPIVGNKDCEAMYKKAGFVEDIPDIFLCAGLEKGGKDSCEGDSGGPLVIQEDDGRWVLVGIISWGIGCAVPNQPGVYTRITKFSDWINQIIIF